MPKRISVNPATINDVSARYALGMVFEGEDSSGRYAAWRYVQFLDAVTYAVGHLCEYADTLGTKVTNDRAGGTSIGHVPAGVACMIMTQNYFGFIQVAGIATVYSDGSVAAAEAVVPHATVDGQADTAVTGAGTVTLEQSFGNALIADNVNLDPLATLVMTYVQLKGLMA